jgi:hypothetical protein
MYHIKREQFLKWMRASYDAINAEIFNGELPRTTIKIENLKDTGANAIFRVSRGILRGPITTHIIVGLHNTYFKDFNTSLYPILIMAHEMLHVYCFYHNIKDTDPDGYHNNLFLEVAKSHGMYCKQYDSKIGYSNVWLTEDQVDNIIDRIPREVWEAVKGSINVVPHLPYQLRSFAEWAL